MHTNSTQQFAMHVNTSYAQTFHLTLSTIKFVFPITFTIEYTQPVVSGQHISVCLTRLVVYKQDKQTNETSIRRLITRIAVYHYGWLVWENT